MIWPPVGVSLFVMNNGKNNSGEKRPDSGDSLDEPGISSGQMEGGPDFGEGSAFAESSERASAVSGQSEDEGEGSGQSEDGAGGRRKKGPIIYDLFVLGVRLLMAGIFVYSGWPKLFDPISFQIKVNEYGILPVEYEQAFSIWLPRLMILCAVSVVPGVLARLGMLGYAGMLLSFLIAVGWNIYQGHFFDCGCFSGEGGSAIGWGLFGQDLVLLCLALVVVVWGPGRLSVDWLVRRRFFGSGAGS